MALFRASRTVMSVEAEALEAELEAACCAGRAERWAKVAERRARAEAARESMAGWRVGVGRLVDWLG